MSSQAPQPRKKVESNLEGTKGTVPSGPLQVRAEGTENSADWRDLTQKCWAHVTLVSDLMGFNVNTKNATH